MRYNRVLVRKNKLFFFCPGCLIHHAVVLPTWKWNNCKKFPVFSPSVRTSYSKKGISGCHSWVGCGRAKPGQIEYLHDSLHIFANKIINLPPVAFGLARKLREHRLSTGRIDIWQEHIRRGDE